MEIGAQYTLAAQGIMEAFGFNSLALAAATRWSAPSPISPESKTS